MGQQQCDLTRQGMSENVLLDDNKGPDHALVQHTLSRYILKLILFGA